MNEGGIPSRDAPAAESVPPYVVQSADNALQLLRALAERKSLRVTDAAELLGVVPSTAHRLLATLCYRGYALHEKRGGTYVPGPALMSIDGSPGQTIDLRSVTRAVLERLREETQETISLVELEGANVHFVDSIDGPQSVRVSSRLGLSLPAHCTSGGKAILATLTREQFLDCYPTSRLLIRSGNSIRTRKRLEAELDVVRSQGYATNFDEGDAGISGVGVAISDGDSAILLAIAVAVPISRLNDDEKAAALARPVKLAAAELRKALGHRRYAVAAQEPVEGGVT